jgi:hypothetical protein
MEDAEEADRFYDDVIMPYKGKLEEWYVNNQNMGLYLLLIFLTAWGVVCPNSRLHWKLFKSLPAVPNGLAGKI